MYIYPPTPHPGCRISPFNNCATEYYNSSGSFRRGQGHEEKQKSNIRKYVLSHLLIYAGTKPRYTNDFASLIRLSTICMFFFYFMYVCMYNMP